MNSLGARWDNPADYARPERFRVVEEGVLYRSAQPTLDDLRRIHEKTGFKTILCVRGGAGNPLRNVWYRNEKAFAKENGVEFIHTPANAQSRTDGNRLAIETFFRLVGDKSKHPILLHCQAGHNRTGILSYFYRIKEQEWSEDRARAELLALGGQESDLRGGMIEQAGIVDDSPAEPAKGPFEALSAFARERLGRWWRVLSAAACVLGLLRLGGSVAYIVPEHRRSNAILWTGASMLVPAIVAIGSVFGNHHAETALWLSFLISRAIYYQVRGLPGFAGSHTGLAVAFVGAGNGIAIVAGLAIGLALTFQGQARRQFALTAALTAASFVVFLAIGGFLPAVTLDAPGIHERSAQNQSLYGLLARQSALHWPDVLLREDTLRPEAVIPIVAIVALCAAAAVWRLVRIHETHDDKPASARTPAGIAYVGWWVLAGVMLSKCAWPGTYVLAAPAIFGTLCCLPVLPPWRTSATAKLVIAAWGLMFAGTIATCFEPEWLGGLGLQWWGSAAFMAAGTYALRGERLRRVWAVDDQPQAGSNAA